MFRINHKAFKLPLVILGAIIFSTVGIKATDVVTTMNNRTASCDAGSALINVSGRAICFDQYEASTNSNCYFKDPKSNQETQNNILQKNCEPTSRPGFLPWRFVTYAEAKQLCARVGKRLPSNAEWYQIALGQKDDSGCALKSNIANPQETGNSACVTATDIYDMAGNVWEWMDETVVNGEFNERSLPSTGYVSLLDRSGIVIETVTDIKDNSFGKDYAWTTNDGVRGMLRGGFYGSGEDGGIFSQNLAVTLDFNTNAVGFRCLKDL